MYRRFVLFAAVASLGLVVVGTEWAAVPAPPVNQSIGMPDVLYGELTEADCRACHDGGLPDRHHLLYGSSIPPGSFVPYPDANRDGVRDRTYGCLNCHRTPSTVVRDCTVCHTATPHHRSAAAMSGDCVSCHGDIVDNMNDGHYIPSHPISLDTPSSRDGDGLPLNSRGNGAGACNYCHDDDGLAVPLIQNNATLHHDGASPTFNCLWCHEQHDPLSIRTCERCHGPDSLHSIQADSPALGNIGKIVVGGELAGYGHVGRDGDPGDSDCWGCHGYAAAATPVMGPVIPTVYSSDLAVVRAGTGAMIVLDGAGFTNTMGGTLYESDVRMTAADGSSVTLEPEIILDQGTMAVTIPRKTRPGNYNIQATKAGLVSNPAVISVVPVVRISRAVYHGKVTILGTGFGGYAKGSATSVTGTITTGSGRRATTKTLTATIASWSDTKIEADFGTLPRDVTVNSLYGSAKSAVSRR
jgi:hypothetical protein